MLLPLPAVAEIEQPSQAPLIEEHITAPEAPTLQPATPDARLPRIQGGPSSRLGRISRLMPPPEDGLNQRFNAFVRVLSCEVGKDKDQLPKELTEGLERLLTEHPACGKLMARELMAQTVRIDIGEVKTIDLQKPLTFLLNRAAFQTKPQGSVYRQISEKKDVMSGLKATLSLLGLNANRVELTLNVQELDVDTSREEQLIFDDGRIFLNPIPVQWERGLFARATAEIGKPEILGGQAYARKPATAEQEVMPENSRLWAEVTLTPFKKDPIKNQ